MTISESWDNALKDEYAKPYFTNLMQRVNEEYATHTVYPAKDNLFAAFKYINYDDVKVVILGQDPYHGEGQANGMAFAVNEGVPLPPSLVNIYKELKSDLGISPAPHGCLESWAKQGVLLLNSVLTVRAHLANSHKNCGWQIFTDDIIKKLNERDTPIVFILWGANARSKKQYITNPIHYVIESAHPSPLSAYNGFFGSKPFSRTNEFLEKNGIAPIEWEIKD